MIMKLAIPLIYAESHQQGLVLASMGTIHFYIIYIWGEGKSKNVISLFLPLETKFSNTMVQFLYSIFCWYFRPHETHWGWQKFFHNFFTDFIISYGLNSMLWYQFKVLDKKHSLTARLILYKKKTRICIIGI